MTRLDEIREREKKLIADEYTILEMMAGCATALKCLHLIDGPCSNAECTICSMLRAIGTSLIAGKFEADKDRTYLLALLDKCREALMEAKYRISFDEDVLGRVSTYASQMVSRALAEMEEEK